MICAWEDCTEEVPVSVYKNGQKYQPKYCKPHRKSVNRQSALKRATSQGIKKDAKGYIQIRVEADGKTIWKPEHRIVMEDHLGRELQKGEEVWHKNGVPDDNRLENLELRAGLSTTLSDLVCPHCGEPFVSTV